ncbi:MAG: DUF3052 domain-containing protein [Cyclobacteriaceae bacterium]|nr:DUF3052 domain-containing protein [Cyclobacteriaceae bacterium]
MPAGYSGTPLAKKLGIKPGFALLLYNAPENYFKLFDDLPDDLVILSGPQSEMADFIHLFCVSLDELKSAFAKYKPALKKTGMLWISWPKGGVPIATDLKRDPIREHLLANGLVDIKVAAVDDTWSGLKFMYRVKDR